METRAPADCHSHPGGGGSGKEGPGREQIPDGAMMKNGGGGLKAERFARWRKKQGRGHARPTRTRSSGQPAVGSQGREASPCLAQPLCPGCFPQYISGRFLGANTMLMGSGELLLPAQSSRGSWETQQAPSTLCWEQEEGRVLRGKDPRGPATKSGSQPTRGKDPPRFIPILGANNQGARVCFAPRRAVP